MSFSFDPGLATNRDWIRADLGDTEATTAILSNEQIDAVLAVELALADGSRQTATWCLAAQTFSGAITAPGMKPASDSTAALEFDNAAGTPIASFNTVSGSEALTLTGRLVIDGVDQQPGRLWTSRTSAADNQWRNVCYGDGLFVAVADSGTGNRVMTSPDGVNWTPRTSAADNSWTSVCYGAGLFVAVSISGTGNRVMTSPDGITWTPRTSAADNSWISIWFANGLFVASAITGTGNRIMTSGVSAAATGR